MKTGTWLAAGTACALMWVPAVTAENKTMETATQTDKEAILAHIDGIFRAFVGNDRDAILKAHSRDWTGFLGPSTKIERGIDDYMVNADRSLDLFDGVGYEIIDTEVQIHGDLALVYYVARYDARTEDGKNISLPLRSLDVYRRQNGDWIQCGSHITPIPQGGSWGEGGRNGAGDKTAPNGSPESSVLRNLSATERGALLKARDEVWHACLTLDIPGIEATIPDELVGLEAVGQDWSTKEGLLRYAKANQSKRPALVKLEFPRTDIHAYGDVVTLYTTYAYSLKRGDEVKEHSGHATETFVRRDGRWLNSGWHLQETPRGSSTGGDEGRRE